MAASAYQRLAFLAFLFAGVHGLGGGTLAQAPAADQGVLGAAELDGAGTVDRGKMRLELLKSLVENELRAAMLSKTQLTSERIDLERERGTLVNAQADGHRADKVRLDRVEERLQQIGVEMAAIDARLPEVTAELGDLQRRLDEANGIVRAPQTAALADGNGAPAEPSASRWLDSNRRIQEALVYFGGYNALIDGDFGPRTREAVRAFQERQAAEPTGELTEEQETALLQQANAWRTLQGVRELDDSDAGYRLTYPSSLLSRVEADGPRVRRLTTPDGAGELVITSTTGEADLDAVYDDALNLYEVQYRRKRGDWFVVAGRVDQERLIYDTAHRTEAGLIRARLTYPVAQRDLWSPFAVIMFNTFEAIPPRQS